MAIKEGFQRGSRVRHVSLLTLSRETDYLFSLEDSLFDERKKPEASRFYYVIRDDSLMAVSFLEEDPLFTGSFTISMKSLLVYDRNKEMEDEELDRIEEEIRCQEVDSSLKEERLHHLDFLRRSWKRCKTTSLITKKRDVREFLIDTGISFDEDDSAFGFLILDLETNGPKWRRDDCLSLTLYDPVSGMAYHRPLPLERLPIVLTGYQNGLTSEECLSQVPLSQDELDFLLDEFDMECKKIIYISSTNVYDSYFLSNYQSRHGLRGFERLDFITLDALFPRYSAYLTDREKKERLSELLSLGNKTEDGGIIPLNHAIHEFRLFEALKNRPLFFYGGNQILEYQPDYLIPLHELDEDDRLYSYAGISLQRMDGKRYPVLSLAFPKFLLDRFTVDARYIISSIFKAFFRNIIKAKDIDYETFEMENLKNARYIGCVDSDEPLTLHKTPGIFRKMKKIDAKKYAMTKPHLTQFYIQLKPVLSYIRERIFGKEEVLAHEIVISDDRKLYSICPFSSRSNILLFVDYDCFSDKRSLFDNLSRDLSFQARGRNVYIVSILVKDSVLPWNEYEVSSIIIRLDRIVFSQRKIANPRGRPRKQASDYMPRSTYPSKTDKIF